jgi:hypothetical protein
MNVSSHRFNLPGLDSPLEGVSADAWRRYVSALEMQPMGATSESGGLGSYDIRPRRLVELGYATKLVSLRSDSGRQIHSCNFIAPWTKARFLADPIAQYTVLAKSTRAYYDALRRGEIVKPKDVSISGALAVLHIGGRGALASWPKLFENTRAIYDAAQGAF